MATIGTFIASDNGFVGSIKTSLRDRSGKVRAQGLLLAHVEAEGSLVDERAQIDGAEVLGLLDHVEARAGASGRRRNPLQDIRYPREVRMRVGRGRGRQQRSGGDGGCGDGRYHPGSTAAQ